MKKIWLLVSVLLLPTASYAQQNLNNSNTQAVILKSFDMDSVTVDATAGGVTLTSARYNPTVTDQPAGNSRAQIASCVNYGAKIWVTSQTTRVLSSGTNGLPILDGQSFIIYGYDDISNFKAIRDASVSSTIACQYSRRP